MKEIKETCYKGTRILLGDKKRNIISTMIEILKKEGFEEISIPVIQYQETFKNKVGEENNNLMFNFTDRGERELCLAPEYTAVIQKLSSTVFKQDKCKKVFYVQECFRGEKPQAGRYRQFTQLGIEIINPETLPFWNGYCLGLAIRLISEVTNINSKEFTIAPVVKRGLDYYNEGEGFEIAYEKLGAQKQICGGGAYQGGTGFAIGIDRILLIN